MNIIKLILVLIGLYLLLTLGFAAIGIISSALWYLFWIGVIAIGGTVGYKLLKKDREQSKLEDKMPIAVAEMNNADRALEEYKRKHLSR